MSRTRLRPLARTTLSLVLLSALALTVPLDGGTAEAKSGGWRRHSRSLSRYVTQPAPTPTAVATLEPITTPTAQPDPAPAPEPVTEPVQDAPPAEATAPAPAPAPVPAPAPEPTPEPVAAPAPGQTPVPATDFFVGAYVPGAPKSISPVTDLESRLGSKLSVVNYFQSTSQGFTAAQASNAVNNGSIPMITLEFWDYTQGVDQPSHSLKSISSGAWDSYLRTYARDAKAFGKTVWLRPLHEMNGNWYPWCGTVNGNSPADFAPAWKRIKTIFAEEGATNVKFVWSVNNDSVPGTTANSIAAYWPGDSYVDYIAIDGYNFGTGDSWSTWRSFGSVFGSAYSSVTKLSSKPIVITEMGCSTSGGDKAAWISDMFRVLPTSFPRIKGIVWFNANKERDWRIESSATSLEAFKTGLAGM